MAGLSPLILEPQKNHPLKIRGDKSPLKNRWFGPTGELLLVMVQVCDGDLLMN